MSDTPTPAKGQIWYFGQKKDLCSVRAVFDIDGSTYVAYRYMGFSKAVITTQEISEFLATKTFLR
mgnify:CR=1 FL=1